MCCCGLLSGKTSQSICIQVFTPPHELFENQLIACFSANKSLFVNYLLKTISNVPLVHWTFNVLLRIKLFTLKNKIV